ncbi:MAG: hypothetical protein LBV13_04320 [Methanomassiliicoccaceae archaeon]|jgi:hypothetical protein|nr:hypothetical protein [Methanomassiliicoccaceae archaeon]
MGKGMVIGVILVVAVVAAAGYYFLVMDNEKTVSADAKELLPDRLNDWGLDNTEAGPTGSHIRSSIIGNYTITPPGTKVQISIVVFTSTSEAKGSHDRNKSGLEEVTDYDKFDNCFKFKGLKYSNGCQILKSNVVVRIESSNPLGADLDSILTDILKKINNNLS